LSLIKPLAEVAISRDKTYQSIILTEVAINQNTNISRHQSKHRKKSPFLEIKPIKQPFWQKSPSIKTQAKVAISRDITHQWTI